MSKKRKEWDRLKVLKKISRAEQRPHGKAGAHSDKRERRVQRKTTEDYLAELEEEELDEEVEKSEGEDDE
jgi:hypothetical protein